MSGEVAAVDFCTIFAKSLLNRKKFVTLSHLIDQVVKGGLGIVERRSLFFYWACPSSSGSGILEMMSLTSSSGVKARPTLSFHSSYSFKRLLA